MRFGRKGKLAPKFISPYEIIAYKLVLLANMIQIHNVFHVLLLCKYIVDPSYVLRVEDIKLLNYLSYEERPM